MIVAIDARELAGRPTGVGRYLEGLLGRWQRPGGREAQDAFLLFLAGETGRLPLEMGEPLRPVVLPPWPELLPGRDTLWQQLTLARRVRRLAPDLFFSPAYSLPLLLRLRCPSVVTVHDLSFEAHPEWFPPRQAARRRQTCRRSCGRAALVITDSLFSREEILRRYGLPSPKVQVVPLAAGELFRPAEDPGAEAFLRRRHGVAGRFLLHAGTVMNRRMVPLLLEAFARCVRAEPGLTLVFAGENRSWPRIDLYGLSARLGVDDRVRALGYLPDEDLLHLYNRAALTVYLSEYEGFGLPPLEALCCGGRVIVSAGGALEENFRGLADLFDGRDPEVLACRILESLPPAGGEDWEARLARSRAARQRFPLERTAAETLRLLRLAAAGGAGIPRPAGGESAPLPRTRNEV